MKFLRLSIILLITFAGRGFAMSRSPKIYKPPSWSEKADAKKDAAFAIKHEDFRLLAYYTRGMLVPGVKPDEKEKLSRKCGLRLLKGFGDVVRSQEQLEKMKAMHDYVVTYNKVITPQCIKSTHENQESSQR